MSGSPSIRIAHISTSALPRSVGGLQIAVDSLIGAQRRLGHDARLITRWRQAQAASHAQMGYPVHALLPNPTRAGNDFRSGRLRMPTELSLAWHQFRNRFDIIHAHWLYPTGWLVERACRKLGLPLVVTSHGADLQQEHGTGYGYRQFPKNELRLRALVPHIDAAVAISDTLRDHMLEIGIPAEKIHRIGNGIDAARFSTARGRRDEVRGRLGIGKRQTLLLCVGRNQPSKGLTAFSDILTGLRADGRDVVACLVGPGTTDLAGFFAEAGLSDRTILLDAIASEETPPLFPPDGLVDLYGAADIFVFPSLSEGAPLVLLEAMAAGLPVIGNRVQGIRDTIEHERTGLLVEPRSANAMIQAIARLCDEPELYRQLVQAGQEDANRHSWGAIAARHGEIYAQLLREKRA